MTTDENEISIMIQIRHHEHVIKRHTGYRDHLNAKLLQLRNPGTSQVCPKCGSTNLIKIATQNLKLCSCGAEIPWHLDKGQGSLL